MDRIAELKDELRKLVLKIENMLQEEQVNPGKWALGLNAAGEDLNFSLQELEDLGVSREDLIIEEILPKKVF